MYRIDAPTIMAEWEEYKKNYPPFVPFTMTDKEKIALADKFFNVFRTQNGTDFDDYVIDDGNKVETHLKEIPVGSKVLFLGTGTGREILLALDMGLDAYGTTLGSRNLTFARDVVKLPEGRLVETLNEMLPWPKDTFDVIAGFQIFEHVMAPLVFLLEQGRVLKSGGLLLLEWPNAQLSMGDNPHHQVCFAPAQAKDLFLKAGFTNIKLFDSSGTSLPEEDKWNAMGYSNPCISGIKKPNNSVPQYIKNAWRQ